MMDQRRLRMSDIVIGKPLPWDIYGEGRQLLLSRGDVVESPCQVQGMVERGLYIDSPDSINPRHARLDDMGDKTEPPSALHYINLANKKLEHILYNLANEAGAQAKIMEVAHTIILAVDTNPDIALASILLNQSAASYATRHCIDTAVVALLVARAMKKSRDDTLLIIAAALTMNLGMLRQHDRLQGKQEPPSAKDRQVIHNHAHESATLLQQCGIGEADWLAYVRLHHRTPDESGQQLGTEAAHLAQNARLVGLADRYCACVTPRRYRKTLLPNAALREVILAGGKACDPVLAAYFIQELGTNPPGAFVRLHSGEIGIVMHRGKSPMMPLVRALADSRGTALRDPVDRDTAQDPYAIRESLTSTEAGLCISMQQIWGNEARP